MSSETLLLSPLQKVVLGMGTSLLASLAKRSGLPEHACSERASMIELTS
jgi:hypothetical protein